MHLSLVGVIAMLGVSAITFEVFTAYSRGHEPDKSSSKEGGKKEHNRKGQYEATDISFDF